MSRLAGLKHIVWSALHRRAADRDTREELAFHVERQMAKHVAAGVPPREARRRAAIELGGVERWRERTADVRRGRLLEDLVRDAAYTVRGLAARPAFALSALATVAIGIGTAATIFAVVDGALLRPLPFPGAARAMSVTLRMPIPAAARVIDMTWSYPKYELFRDRQRAFSALALHDDETMVLSGPDGAERVSGEMAGAAYFAVLGVRPALGRTYTAAEDAVGAPGDVVVVSDDFWRRRLGGRPSAVGETLRIDGRQRTIIGVMAPGFRGLSGDAQLWLPVPARRSAAVLAQAGAHNMELVGRLADGVGAAEAGAAVASLGASIDEAYPADEGHWSAAAYTFAELRVNAAIRRSIELLALAAGLLLAIVCVNLSTLLLTRGAARRQELAIRLALGGSRARVVRQLVTESAVLALLGLALGLAIAFVATRELATMLPQSMPTTGSVSDLTRLSFLGVRLDARAVGFAALLALAVGVGVGLLSSARVARPAIVGALRQGGGSTARDGAAPRMALVGAQVALALAFLVASGLTLESFRRTLAVPLGYRPDGLLAVNLTLDPIRARNEPVDALWRGVLDEVRAVPGVRAVALGECSPLGDHCDGTGIEVAGRVGSTHVMLASAAPGYFETLGTRFVRGRDFQLTDGTSAERVMIVNREAARLGWGGEDPLSTPAVWGGGTVRVVGIVEDARYGDVEEPARPAIFLPFGERTRGVVFIRTDRDAASLVAPVRAAIHRAGAGNAPGEVRTMTSQLREATVRERLGAQVFTGFALCALLLAAIGVYGTAALAVLQRGREFAIRRALGASAASLVRVVARDTARVIAGGGVAGVVLALAVGRELSGVLHDVSAGEPRVYATSVLLLLAVVIAASAVPTARSVRVDPRVAMRAE
ncbi:MAG TPA: ADOP family duplicated permease [Longimicrobiales bacterium]|nr:ADOP family duplicated permease [Longimicrobiales bacterium]